MSKSSFDSSDIPDRIPTYEEALASSSSPPPNWRRRTTSTSTNIREERTRRIFEVVTNAIIPKFATHVSNLCNHVTIVLVPADVLPTASTVTEQNVVSPSLQKHRTTGNVVVLKRPENHSTFWTQQTVVAELDHILRRELSSPAPVTQSTRIDEKTQSPSLPPLQVQPTSTRLPSRPCKLSWLKRTLILPGEDHDPTGETGKWNLGWRSPETLEKPAENYGWTARSKDRSIKLQPDEVAVETQLQDVSFRIENEMGLLETSTVKCIWIEIEVGV
ncbi:hypothetical protein H2200_001272 [Cladophialophora chaetospira]|uniref:Uncharacterized protein n=1 Tax=Cladophialophora chaetospira TaxID=386627 RepID=A0AA38XKP6_9EURO|nr:hypothetical protein H2200_001272 [Cladophialophora chaetospira]